MGRGNQDKRRFQAAHSGKGFLDASDIVRSQKRERPTRDQRPSTFSKVVPPVPDAVPTGPTETVRRGWNRTAGSRYEFAADGVTFESSGGI